MCIVADKKFHKYLDINTYCMEQIKLIGEAIQAGFSEDEIRIVANPQFHWEQMREVIRGLKAGLPLTQVSQYARTCYNPRQMYQIYLAMLVGCNQANVDKAISGGKLFWEHMYRKYDLYDIAEKRALSKEKKQKIKESLTQKQPSLTEMIYGAEDNIVPVAENMRTKMLGR